MSKMHSNNVSAYCYDEQIRIPVEILRAFFCEYEIIFKL
jgi:hypothetical protein